MGLRRHCVGIGTNPHPADTNYDKPDSQNFKAFGTVGKIVRGVPQESELLDTFSDAIAAIRCKSYCVLPDLPGTQKKNLHVNSTNCHTCAASLINVQRRDQ